MINQEKVRHNLIPIVSCLTISYVLIQGVFKAGYFFDVSYYRSAIPLSLLSAVVLIGWLYWAAGDGSRLAQQIKGSYLLCLWPVLIAGLYLLQPLWMQVSVMAAIEQGLRWSSYAGFLIIGLTALRLGGKRAAVALTLALWITGLLLMASGLAGWLGWLEDPRLVMVSSDPLLSAVGARVAGPLQYPNMYGAVLAAFLAWYWQRFIGTTMRAEWVLSWLLAVPAGALLLLTESRGAWLATAAVWAVGFYAVQRERRAEWLLYPLIACVGSAALYGSLLTQRYAGQPSSFLILSLLIAVSTLGIGWGLRRGLRCLESHHRIHLGWMGGALLLLVIRLLLPTAASGRLEAGNYTTAAARWQFFGDAWQLVRQTPWLGSGGDAWRHQVGRLQSSPYVGNEVHSGYINQLLELGWVGLALLLLFLGHLLFLVWLRNKLAILPPLVLLLHAAVDFDMAYGFYWLLICSFTLLAIGGPSEGYDARLRSRGRSGLSGISMTDLLRSRGHQHGSVRPWRVDRPVRAVRALSAVLAASVLVVAGLAGLQADGALRARSAALAAPGDARLGTLRAALTTHPYDTRMRLELAALAPLPERAALLAAGLRYDPQSVPLMWALGAAYAERGDVQQAAAYLRRALQWDRYDKAKQSAAVQWLARLAAMHREAGRTGEALAAAAAGAEVYARYDRLARRVELRGAAEEGRRFTMLPQATAAARYCRELLRSHGYG